MKALAEQVFISEIVFQSKIAQRAAEDLLATRENFDPIEVWRSIQSILVASGNVSKILWPRKKYAKRGERLRSLLNVEESNLLSNRIFRNHFEHYDERIEEWFETNSSASYTDSVIDPFKSIWGMITVQHRAYNPLTQVLTFRDESVDLREVLKVMEDIRHKCDRFALP